MLEELILEFRAPQKGKSQVHFLRTPEGILLPRKPKIIPELSLKSVQFLVRLMWSALPSLPLRRKSSLWRKIPSSTVFMTL